LYQVNYKEIKGKRNRMKKVISLLFILTVITGCGTVPLTGRKQVMLVSDQEVLTSSLTQYHAFMDTAKVSKDKVKTAQVVRVGKKIAAATEAYLTQNGLADEVKEFSWEFNLVQDPSMNAFCMPGGKIVVYEGIMKIVHSDDDLAVVLGHEVAHAVAKHSNERMSQQLLSSYGGALLGVAVGQKSQALQEATSMAYALGSQYGVMLPFSRKHESEADYMGLILMTMAGYNPEAAVSFWQNMQSMSGGSVPEFLSTHPSNEHRISDIKKEIPQVEAKYKK